jgi:DNA-binding transcriptional ArsR family regulator
MDINSASRIFSALAQDTRLKAYRLLVQAGPTGMPAGVLSEQLGVPHNTLSFHLSHLAQAGIVSSIKQGRYMIYSANFETIGELIGFMVKDCCSDEIASIRQDRKTGCSVIELADCCLPASKKPQPVANRR